MLARIIICVGRIVTDSVSALLEELSGSLSAVVVSQIFVVVIITIIIIMHQVSLVTLVTYLQVVSPDLQSIPHTLWPINCWMTKHGCTQHYQPDLCLWPPPPFHQFSLGCRWAQTAWNQLFVVGAACQWNEQVYATTPTKKYLLSKVVQYN